MLGIGAPISNENTKLTKRLKMTVALEGDTLGKKHQYHNKLVQDAVANRKYELSQIKSDDSDLNNLLKIDIACETRNVDYIIEVLKCNDMLYVSRAIKKSPWLITDPQYANIINPEYLHSQLFPTMHTKAVNKLMLNIRLHLKNPCRVEAFYNYLKGSNEACKWLLNCSLPFSTDAIQNERNIPLHVFKRLCKKSISFLSYYEQVEDIGLHNAVCQCSFLLWSHPTQYLEQLEKQYYLFVRKMGRKRTEYIMTKCSQRVFDKFDFYVDLIDLSVVAKHLKTTGIKAFLEEQIKRDIVKLILNHYRYLKHFVKNMPEDERYLFILETFIDKEKNAPLSCLKEEYDSYCYDCYIGSYHWYKYAPYNEAFNNLVKLLRAETSPTERLSILSVLIKCARNNPEHIKSLLHYYHKKHINEPFNMKIEFINKVLTQIPTYKFDNQTWNILDHIFRSMKVYSKSENDVQTCLKSIIMYKVTHDAKVPEIVEQKFKFDTFKNDCNKLSQENKDKLFSYLFNLVSTQIQNQAIKNESDCDNMVRRIHNAYSLLIDWKKDINDYPFILDHIKKLIIVKKDKSWNTDLSSLYNVKKSWRKYMFEDSFAFCVNEEVCLNALKHKPQLLTRHDAELDVLRTNDKVTLRRLLAKLRVYWPQSIAQQWTDAYLLNLKTAGKKAVVRGLFMLMPHKQVIEIAEKHKPKDYKINWGETNSTDINLRKYIAECLYVARPLVPLETVMWYAKEDYLQYAVPSINAVMYYMSKEQSRDCLTMLLEAPVSLQKFGIRYAFDKLRPDELKPIYSKIWLSSKNLSIRAVLFIQTYKLLCKANNASVEREIWELFSTFIDSLTSDDNKEMFIKLTKLKDLPIGLKPAFFMKSYDFLMSLPEKVDGQKYVRRLLQFTPKLIGSLDEDFVVEKMLTPLEETIFSTKGDKAIEFLSIFVLSSKNEEDQLRRYRRVLIPAMEHAFNSWNDYGWTVSVVKNKFNDIVSLLIWHFVKLVSLHKITPPAKLFMEIQKLMEEKMDLQQNYVLYTSWKLTTEYVKLVDENKSLLSVFEPIAKTDIKINSYLPEEIRSLWNDMNMKVSQQLGLKFGEHLKKDIKQYRPTIQKQFCDAISKTFQDLYQNDILRAETLYHMLDEDFIPSCMVVSYSFPKYEYEEILKTKTALREKLKSHPSKEVRMYYYIDFDDFPDNV